MWLSHNVCDVVGICVTVCVVLAVSAEETKDLARGTVSPRDCELHKCISDHILHIL